MPLLTQEDLSRLAKVEREWCVTITAPLFPAEFDRRRAQLKLRHLLEYADARLEERGMSEPLRHELLAPVRDLVTRDALPRDGQTLVALLAPSLQEVHSIAHEVPTRVEVGTEFALADLAAVCLSQEAFYALALSDDEARLIRATPNGPFEIPLPLERASRSEANAERVSPTEGGNLHATRYGSGAGGKPTAGMQGFGHEDRDAAERRTWYDYVDAAVRAVTDATVPLVLIADVPHHAPYRAASKLKNLSAEGVKRQPHADGPGDLLAMAEPHARTSRTTEALEEDLAAAAQQDLPETDFANPLEAAALGQVRTLAWTPGQHHYGKVLAGPDGSPQGIELHAGPRPGNSDLLDALIARTLRSGGDLAPIHGAGPELAAILRWKTT